MEVGPLYKFIVVRLLPIMIIVVIQVQVKPEQVEAFKALTLPNAQDRANSAGNLRFEVYQQADDSTQFVMIEVFRSQAEIDAYYETPSYRDWHEATADMIVNLTGNDHIQLFPELQANP